MEKINDRSKVDVLLKFKWNSLIGEHEEIYFCRMNVWRDFQLLPEKVRSNFYDKRKDEKFNVHFKRGELFNYSEENIIDLNLSHFNPPNPLKTTLKPKLGRFYPLGFFSGLAGVFPQNTKPIRVIEIDREKIKIDVNSPISKYDLEVEIHILDIVRKTSELGGECKDWFRLSLDNGPGIQVRYNGLPTDFGIEDLQSFRREDERDDKIFYKEPRITTHIDSKAHDNLLEIYRRVLPEKGKILDLMSSYQSHIPENKNRDVIGLGLNEEEMKQNIRLNSFIVHDINEDPRLPFRDEEFDVVVCDLSIEYVVKPVELVSEIRRILKREGTITFSFSNRYFQPKVIKLWTELHEFERMGYVLELLLRNEGFKNFKTYSVRGFDRPFDDKYFGSTFLSDPLYVVYAQKA